MFKNEYQGGSFFEIFSAQGKDPTANWKLCGGSGIRKVYEKDVKSFVYTLEGTVATTKMQIPKDLKQSLSLVQRYLVAQINVAQGAEFSLELGISDINNNKRRINLSSSIRESYITPLHAKLPLSILRKSVWVNACFDMVSLTSTIWAGQTFAKVDNITISATCKIRRIFTMKYQLCDNTDDEDALSSSSTMSDVACDSIPRQHQLPNDIVHFDQVINMQKIRSLEQKVRGDKAAPADMSIDLNASGRKSQFNDSFHIAFGSKVGKPLTAGRKFTTTELPAATRFSAPNSIQEPSDKNVNSRFTSLGTEPLKSSRFRLSSDPGATVATIAYNNNPLNESRSWSGAEIQEQKAAFVKPHPPPRDSSAEPIHRRKPKVRSGDRQNRTAADAHLKPLKLRANDSQNTQIQAVGSGAVVDVREGNSRNEAVVFTTMSTNKGYKLAPLDRRKGSLSTSESSSVSRLDSEPEKPSLIQGVQWPVLPQKTMTKQNVADTNPFDNDDSVADVIDLLKGRIEKYDLSDEEDEKKQLLDSLQKFAADAASSNSSDDDTSIPMQGLFTFSSAPKAIHNVKHNGVVKYLRKDEISVKPLDTLYKTQYNPTQYTKQDESDSSVNNITEAEQKQLQPRPPNSPRVLSKPGSGKLSRAGRGNTTFLTPDTSGTGDELREGMKGSGEEPIISKAVPTPDIASPATSKNNIRQQYNSGDLDNMPSPRASENEPRISSGHRRPGSGSSRGSASSKEEPLILPPMPLSHQAERTSTPLSGRSSTRLSRRSLKEIPENDRRFTNQPIKISPETDKRMINAQYSPASPDILHHRCVHDTFDEAKMLLYLKQEQESGSSLNENYIKSRTKQYEHEVTISEDGDVSSDESLNTAPVLSISAHDYKAEMQDTLERSDTRDNSMFSPPIVRHWKSDEQLVTESMNASAFSDGSNKGGSVDGKHSHHFLSTTQELDEEEEELDLLYDPVLNCYFDPKTCKYYELA